MTHGKKSMGRNEECIRKEHPFRAAMHVCMVPGNLWQGHWAEAKRYDGQAVGRRIFFNFTSYRKERSITYATIVHL